MLNPLRLDCLWAEYNIENIYASERNGFPSAEMEE